MKKNFVEPELVRIDLKMTENIATSQGDRYFRIQGGIFNSFATRQYVDMCSKFVAKTEIEFAWVLNSGLTMELEDMFWAHCRHWRLPIEN